MWQNFSVKEKTMRNLKKILKDMETATLYIGKKTKDSLDNIKLKKQLYDESKKLSRLYEALGKISFDIHSGRMHPASESNSLCSQIKEQIQLIEQLKNKLNRPIEEIENEETKDSFLDNLENLKEEPVENEHLDAEALKPELGEDGFLLLKFCPNCQTGNHPESKKCIACGQILNGV